MTQSKKEVTDDDLYRHTSQFRLWSFTRDEFPEKHRQTYEHARLKLKASLDERQITEIEPLEFQEERDLVRFYASKIGDIATIFNMPSQVKATATSYFLKFYLVNSVMEYHPKNVMYTTVFFASKSENCFIGIKDFCSRIKGTVVEEVLNLEYVILQSLQFTIAVHSGLKPLHGFFLDIQSSVDRPASELGLLYDKARKTVLQGLVSNAQFFYTPPQIALAALMDEGEPIVREYLAKRYTQTQADQLVELLGECLAELKDCAVITNEEAKRIDKKLHRCINPEKYMNNAKRKAEEVAESVDPNKRARLDTPEGVTAVEAQSEEASAKREEASQAGITLASEQPEL